MQHDAEDVRNSDDPAQNSGWKAFDISFFLGGRVVCLFLFLCFFGLVEL